MRYIIYGSTYAIKDELIAFGCRWNSEKKQWLSKEMDPDSVNVKRLKSLVEAAGGYIIREPKSVEEKRVYNVLRREGL